MENSLFFRNITLLNFIFVTNWTFCIPILPDFLYDRGLSLTVIGAIFSSYQIAFFLSSMFMGKLLPFYSKQQILFFGQLLLTFSTLCFPILSLPLPDILLTFFASFFRASQGVGYSIISLVIWFYFPVLFPNEADQTYVTAEIWRGLGMSVGPILGGLFYQYFGYTLSFFTIGSLYFLTMLYFYSLLKPKQESLENELSVTSPFLDRPLVTFTILRHTEFLFAFFMFFFNYVCYGLIQPGFSQHIHTFVDNDYAVGLVFRLFLCKI